MHKQWRSPQLKPLELLLPQPWHLPAQKSQPQVKVTAAVVVPPDKAQGV